MKQLTLWMLLLCSFSIFAKSSDLCIAQRVDMISYASTIHYQVNCEAQQFNSARSLTSVVLPLPYNWNAVARENLVKLMNGKGFFEAAEINEVSEVKEFKYGFNQTGREVISMAFDKPVIIFSKSQKTRNICGVVQSNQQVIGISRSETIFDYVISCDHASVRETFSGITRQELNDYMKNLGTEFATSANYLGDERTGRLLIFEEKPSKEI